MKDKLFKFLFPDKFDLINSLNKIVDGKIAELELRAKKLEKDNSNKPTMSDLMRDSLGLPMIYFHNVDSEGLPPHFLAGLNSDQRKQYITELVGIYKNDKFKAVLEYTINVFGNHLAQKAGTDDARRNGQVAIVAIKTLRKQFEDVVGEYEDLKKGEESFDEQAVLPE